jgi:DNA processing protein
MDDEKKCWIGFSVFPGIGPVRFKLLSDYFGSAKGAWDAPLSELKKIGLGTTRSEAFDHFRKTFDLDGYINKLSALHVSVLTLTDPKYPALLKKISDAPFLLYVRGKSGYREGSEGKREKVPIHTDRTIAVVGTRTVSRYGVEVTQKLVADLVLAGITIVSGMAYGVDAVAHQAALDAGGQTIAVLGCGVDVIAPPSNRRLYQAIIESGRGAIVSEMPLGLRPNKGIFPARNRIISGLSLGVLVTEGADDSGALITARYAAEQGRDVFAVPGPITNPMSRAPAKLLKSGAKLVESVDDILEELKLEGTLRQSSGQALRKDSGQAKSMYDGVTKEEKKIMSLLTHDRIHVDEIVRVSGLTTAVVAATLTILEMNGVVKDYGEKVYGLT